MSESSAAHTIEDNNFNIPSRKSDSSYYTLQKMNQLHHEIVRRIVLGQKDIDIARALDITQATVQYVKRSPIVKQKIDIMHGARDASTVQLQKQINALAPLALHNMSEIMEDKGAPSGVRANIAKDILDRAGFKPANVNINKDEGFKREQLDEIKKRAKANGILFEVDSVEDAEFEEGEDVDEFDENDDFQYPSQMDVEEENEDLDHTVPESPDLARTDDEVSVTESMDGSGTQNLDEEESMEASLDKSGSAEEQPDWDDGDASIINEEESQT